MSDVETLRRAASLIRERAEAATPGPWLTHDDIPDAVVIVDSGGHFVLEHPVLLGEDRTQPARDAEHIASWDPAVALAVADWLDEVAGRHRPIHGDEYRRALAVARAYLGES